LHILFVVEIFTKHGSGLLLFAAPCRLAEVVLIQTAKKASENVADQAF